MKVAVIYSEPDPELSDVINILGPIAKESYNKETVEKVASALKNGGHDVRIFEANIEVVENLDSFMPEDISKENPAIVFNMSYGIQGRSRYTHIPALLEMLGVPYVGSEPKGHAIALDKGMSKRVFRQRKIPTPNFKTCTKVDDTLKDINLPVIVKPKMEAESFGLKVVRDYETLCDTVKRVVETYQQPALIEDFIPGCEFAVGLLGNGDDIEVLPIVEIDFGGDSNAIKSFGKRDEKPFEVVCPAKLSKEKAQEISRESIRAFQALNLHDYARVDIRMDKDENIYILEINSMASLEPQGTYVTAAEKAGYTYESMINRMLDVAADRYFG